MKPFDLQAALAGAKVQTRDGREVTELYFFKTAKNKETFPVSACVDGKIISFTKNGKWGSQGSINESDLFMVSEKKEYWINVWRSINGNIGCSSIPFLSKTDALDIRRNAEYLGDPVKIWEEEV